jgi:ATP adenylyltransferase
VDILWAGWRSEYVRSADDRNQQGCLFCCLPEETDEQALILERGELAYSVLNRFPYSNGHLMVTQYRHVADSGDLTDDEAAELWRLLGRAKDACAAALSPDGFNIGANLGRLAGAGIPDHFHVHLVPRWAGDTSFMTTVGATRVVPEDIGDTFAKLRAALGSLD